MKSFMRAFLFFSPVIFFLLSCSKDKMLERRVHKQDGEWNIEQVNWTIVYQNGSGQQVVRSGSTNDAGKFTFDKDKGTYSYTIDTFARSG